VLIARTFFCFYTSIPRARLILLLLRSCCFLIGEAEASASGTQEDSILERFFLLAGQRTLSQLRFLGSESGKLFGFSNRLFAPKSESTVVSSSDSSGHSASVRNPRDREQKATASETRLWSPSVESPLSPQNSTTYFKKEEWSQPISAFSSRHSEGKAPNKGGSCYNVGQTSRSDHAQVFYLTLLRRGEPLMCRRRGPVSHRL
jgi:hypothetical protein